VENIEGLKALFDLGGVVVVTAMLWIVWRRLNDVTDQLIDILHELRIQTLALHTKQSGAETKESLYKD